MSAINTINASYSTKATAVRGARRAGLADDAFNIETNEEGRFIVLLNTSSEIVDNNDTDADTDTDDNTTDDAGDDNTTDERQPLYKEMHSYARSTVIKPFNVVHSFLDANPDMKRKDAIVALVNQGVNFSTARTQYQRWFKKNKR